MFFETGAFRNFPIFTGKHLCWSHFLIKLQAYFNTCFLVNIAKFFDSKSPVASVDLLFLIKSNVGWFLLKRVDLVIVRVIYTLLVETIPTRFYWLTCRKQKLVQSKSLEQRLFVLILGFWQCRQVFVHYLMSILMICKLTRGYIYQVASSEFPLFRCNLFWKRIDPKTFLYIGINNWIHGFRDSVVVRKLYACC